MKPTTDDTPRTPQPWPIQLYDLLLMELSNWRWTWRMSVITGMIAPICGIMALGVFARDSKAQSFAYVLIGNLVLSLTMQSMVKMESRFSFMRSTGTLDFFASLPIRRGLFVAAITLSFFILSLPALLVTIFFGTWFLEIPLHPDWLFLLVLPLASLPLSGLGALIGTTVSQPEQGATLTNALSLLLLALGPVVVPPERLPATMIQLSYLSPVTYVASALRQTLLGPISARLWLDLLMLILFSAFSFWIVGRKMDWRQK